MKYLSVCSGIEAATCAWHSLGFEPVAFSEIEKFPSKVLAHHYPTVPNLGDMTKFKEWNLGTIDLLVGGTPCQSFSVAGLRKGLDDPRGNLMLTYLAIAEQFKPKWLVWENVPGVLSSNKGKDFGSLLGGLAELGYGFAYRILDAQYFGVPQRRRRVFVVGCLGDWRAAAAVLFEHHSMCGNPAPQREAGESVAGKLSKCSFDGGAAAGHFQVVHQEPFRMLGFSDYVKDDVASTMKSRDGKDSTDLITFGIQANIIGRQDHNGGNGIGVSEGIAPTLTKADKHAVAIIHGTQDPCSSNIAFALGRNNGQENVLVEPMAFQQVRRMTPRECERLQGFPDNYTNIKGAADSPRYKALGNSMAVPVMRWIGERIKQVESIHANQAL